MKPLEFVDAVREGALRSMREYGVPASFIVAQAALESGWGRSRLAQEANNLFGIKAHGWSGPVIELPTREFLDGEWQTVTAAWRRYDSYSDSIMDHGRFLRGHLRYSRAFTVSDPRMFAVKIHEAGYATDPDYAGKIINIMQGHNLAALDTDGGVK